MNRAFLLIAATFVVTGFTVARADDPRRAIERSEIHRTFDASLRTAFQSGDPQIAARAALAIGRTHGGLTTEIALVARMRDANPTVRAMTIFGIGLLAVPDPALLRSLEQSATSDENSGVRYAAVDALGRTWRTGSLAGTYRESLARTLLHIASGDSDPNVRGHAALQLDVVADTTPASRAIAKQLQAREIAERDPSVRWHIAFILYRSYAALADPAFLTRMLHDRDEFVRVETLRAFGKRADRSTTPLVTAMLNDPSWRVQYEAREALRALVKLPRTEHLASVPPGLHLPTIRTTPVPYRLDASTVGVAPFESPRAPDPDTFPLSTAPLPDTAAAMNGPAPGPHPRVLIRTTRGDVVVRLYPEWAPSTVANFIDLAQAGYFDGNRWFRIVPDFVAQTGDPTGDPDAEAGYTIPAEENPVEQRAGIIAMGLDYENGKPVRDSAGTQFYLTLSPQPYLGRDFSVFGEIESGWAVVANLVERDRMTLVRRIADD